MTPQITPVHIYYSKKIIYKITHPPPITTFFLAPLDISNTDSLVTAYMLQAV